MHEGRTRSIALCGLSIALLVISGLFTVPLGPVPFTLQTAALVLIICVLSPKEAICTVAGYLAMGAVGLPVFAQMSGGIAVLLGPSGGFLFGFLIGTVVAGLTRHAILRGGVGRIRTTHVVSDAANVHAAGDASDVRAAGDLTSGGSLPDTIVVSTRRNLVADIVAAAILLIISYLLGWAQLMFVMGLDAGGALLAGIVPFVIPDILKSVVAIGIATPVRIAIGRQRGMVHEHASAA